MTGRITTGQSPFTASVNGTAVAVINGNFTGTVTPTEGAFTITVAASDSAGASGQATRTIDVDRSPPVITMLRPTTNPATATAALVTIEGEAGDPHLAEVRVQGRLVPTLAGRFITDVSLSAGRTDVLIEAVDSLGNRSSFTQRFDAPALPPTVTILAPADGASVDDAIVRVRARVNGSVAIARVEIGTGQAQASPTGDYEADVPLALGLNTITVRAIDVDGREGTAQVQVRFRDATTEPLRVTGIDPNDGAAELEPDRRISIAFNKAIQPADFSTQFVVKANGSTLPGGYYLVPGNQTLSFAATSPLPEGQTLTVEVQNVSPQVGPGLSSPFRASFTVRRALTELHGIVLDETATPLANVLVSIESLGLSTRTSGQGNWSLFVPGGGQWVVTFAGPQLGDGRGLPTTKRRVFSTEGQRTDERTVFLVSIDPTGAAQLNNDGQPARAGVLTITAPPNSIAFADGRLAGRLTITSVPIAMRAPPLSDRIGPTHLWQSFPGGTRVLSPISASVPNEENAPAGRLALFYAYAPEAFTISRVGFGRVTADGARIETLPPFQPASLEWFGYRLLSPEESTAVEAVLNPPAPAGNNGTPDGSLGWLKWAPKDFDSIVDVILPRAYAQQGSFFDALNALQQLTDSFVPAVVRGRVLAGTSFSVFNAETPAGLPVGPPAGGSATNPPSPAAYSQLQQSDAGVWLLPFKAVGAQRPGATNATSRVELTASARRGNLTQVAPLPGWSNGGTNAAELNSFVELVPGVTFLTFQMVEGTRVNVIEHRIDFALGEDGGTGSLAVTEVGNTKQGGLDSLVRFPGVGVTFNGINNTGTIAGPAGDFGFSLFTPGSSVGIACAQVPAGFRLAPELSLTAGASRYVATSYDFCSPQLSVAPGNISSADISVDARLFFGTLTFRDRQGNALPTRCDESLEWDDTGDVELTSVSKRDVSTTEISIFKADDLNEPIAVVAPGRYVDTACERPDAGLSAAAYSMLRLGPQSLIRSNQLAFCREIDALGGPFDSTVYRLNCGTNRAATVQAGDPLVIVAVNYRTGYAGLTRTRVPTINQLRGLSPDAGTLPDGGLTAGVVLPDGGCSTPPVRVLGTNVLLGPGAADVTLPSCTVQSIGVQTDLSLYPPELEMRVSREIRPRGLVGAAKKETLVRTGGMATTGDTYLRVSTRWGVKTEPAAYRRCVAQQPERADLCRGFLREAANDEERDAGTLRPDGGRPDAGALIDVGYRGLALEVPCGDLPPGAPDAAWNVCLADEPRIVDLPAAIAPLSGQLVRWTGSAVESPEVAAFDIKPGNGSNVVQVSQTVFTAGATATLSNLPRAVYYVHAVGQSQFGEVSATGASNNRLTPAVGPAPFFTPRVDGGSLPARAIALKSVYSSFEPGAVVVERYDATREHEFRVVELDAGAYAYNQADGGVVTRRDLTVATASGPSAEEGDLRYLFTSALLGPATQTRAQQPLREFRIRIGSDAFGRECDVLYDTATQTLRGQCDADAVEDVLAANDIVYLELYLAGNAGNVLWRTNFYGLTRRTDIVSSNSRYTHSEANDPAARARKSRQTTIRPIATFPLRQHEVPNNTNATVRVCSDATCTRTFASALIRRENQRFRIVSVDTSGALAPVGATSGMGPDGTALFATQLPEDYAEVESHDSTVITQKKVFRVVEVAAPGPQPSPELLGRPRGRFESFDNGVWAQPQMGPVSITTGRLAFEHTDIAVPYSPSVMAFTRSYNNQNNTPGVLGVGWRHPFEASIVQESPVRFVATIGSMSYQFIDCGFSAGATRRAGGQCDTDGIHGAQLDRFEQPSLDGGDSKYAYVVTEVSGRRLLFRDVVPGDKFVELADGGRDTLQKRWFLSGLDEGPGVMPGTGASQWFGELPANWQVVKYSPDTSRVERVYREGVDGGLEWRLEYASVPDDAEVSIKSAARLWGLKPLRRVGLRAGASDVASVTFTQQAATHALLSAVRSTGTAAEQEWAYEYAAVEGSGITASEASNEVSKVELKLAPPDGGTRLTQWRGLYDRTATGAPLVADTMPQVSAKEFVTQVRQPGQQGVPAVLTGGQPRLVERPTGERTEHHLADYGASNRTKTDTIAITGTWPSQKTGSGVIKPSFMEDATGVAQKAEFDDRLRTTGALIAPGYTLKDTQLPELAAGPAATTVPDNERFAHAQTTTEPPSGTRVSATVSKTEIDTASGDTTAEKVTGEGGPFVLFESSLYDSQHRLKVWKDEEGRTVTVEQFDDVTGLPRVLKLTKPGAASGALATLTRQLSYDSYGRVTRSKDVETGAETLTEYDAVGRELKRTRRGSGADSPDEVVVTTYELSDNGLKVTKTYPGIPGYRTSTTTVDGLVTASSWTYGLNNALTATEESQYDAGRLVERKDARGVTHAYEYQAGTGLFLSEKATSDAGTVVVRRVSRDDMGRVTREVDALGAEVVASRDSKGDSVGSVAPDAGASYVKTLTDLSGYAEKALVGAKQFDVTTNALGLPAKLKLGAEVDVSQTFDSAGRVITRGEAVSGLVEEFEYNDVLGRLTKYSRRFPSATGQQSLEELRRYNDTPGGKTTVTIERGVSGRVETETQVVDTLGRLLSKTEAVTRVGAPSFSATTQYRYDALGRMVTMVHASADAATRQFVYDGPGALVSETDEAGETTTVVRDALGLDTSTTGPLGLSVVTTHDAAGRLTARTEGNGAGRPASEWTYTYPGGGWVHERAPAPTLDAARLTKRRFNGRGQVVEVQQHAGTTTRVTTSAYNGNQASLVEVTDGAWVQRVQRDWDGQGRAKLAHETWTSGTASYDYRTTTTWVGRVATVSHAWTPGTAPSGETWEYDGLGNATRHVVGEVVDRWARDGLGRLASVTTADAPTRVFEYGQDGRLSSETFGSPVETTQYGYNARGLAAVVRTPDGRETSTAYEFDTSAVARRRSLPTRVKVGFASGTGDSTTTETDYDALGRASAVRSGVGTGDVQQQGFTYGPRGELRAVTQPGGATWAYEHDGLLRLTRVTPPAGSVRPQETWEYGDGLGRVTQHQVGPSAAWVTTYVGGVATTTTPKGETSTVVVDGRGRAASVQYGPGATTAPGLTAKRMKYDGWDALVEVEDVSVAQGLQTQTFGYDTSQRLQNVVRGLAVVSTTYAPGTRRRATQAGVAYAYDGNGRLASVTAPWGTTAVVWELGGQRLKTLGGETFDYDGRGWLASVTSGGSVRTYGYDGRGNRLTETVTGATPGAREFAYDATDRLVATKEWDGHVEAWKLHPDGARQEEKQWPAGTAFGQPFNFSTPSPTKLTTYGYDDKGALTTVTDSVSGVVLAYGRDATGQATSRTLGGVVTQYGWDTDGRLVTATSSGPGLSTLAATYEYDGLGMRRRAQVAITPTTGPPAVTTTRTWLWGGADGEEEVAEDAEVTTHVAGFRVGDGPTSFTHDALGSVVSQTTGGSTAEAQYNAWGSRTALVGPLASSAGFTGHRTESALALTYAKRRWLDSSTGTWLSRDDIGAASYLQSPNELNPWLYAGGNPTRYTDPDGRSNECGSEGGPAGPGGTPESCGSPELSAEAKMLLMAPICAHAPQMCVIGAGFSGLQQTAGMADDLSAGRPVRGTDYYAMAQSGAFASIAGPVFGRLSPGVQGTLTYGGAALSVATAGKEFGEGNNFSAAFNLVGGVGGAYSYLGAPKLPNWRLPPPAARPASAIMGGGSMAAAGDAAGVAVAAGDPTVGSPLAVAMAAARGPQLFLPGLGRSQTPRLPVPFEEGEIGRYGDFDLQRDGLDGHELLQNAWLEAHKAKNVGGVFWKADNPAIALREDIHVVVSRYQRRSDLFDPSVLKKQSALENIEANAEILLQNGVSPGHVKVLREFAILHARALGFK